MTKQNLSFVPSSPSGAPPQKHAVPRLSPTHRILLLIAFAFTVMADPISSVAYAIEAALRALAGNLALLFPTMALVIAVIAIVTLNYHQLVARFPEGGGAAAAAGAALGETWAFLPIGSLIVDFALTIAISVAASASAIVAYFPALAGVRVAIALGLLLLVAGLTWFGHGGRTLFALMTLGFVGIGIALLLLGGMKTPSASTLGFVAVPTSGGLSAKALGVALAFPVAMALATGVEAPSSAIAQLGQLDAQGRKQFGQVTLWLTLVIVGSLTLGLTALAVRFHVGIPPQNSTQIAGIAQVAGNPFVFAAFQLTTTLLLLSAASSSFQAGPGLFKALARRVHGQAIHGILPAWMGRTNRHYTPYWSVALYTLIAGVVVLAANAQDQELVLFYAVAVFVSFLIGLLAMAHFSWQEHKPWSLAINILGALVVAFTLAMNLLRGWPLLSLAAAILIAGSLWMLWVRAGRPRGISMAVQESEHEELVPFAETRTPDEFLSREEEIEHDQTTGADARQAGEHE